MKNKKIIYNFIKISIASILFGVLFFFIERMLGLDIEPKDAIFSALIYWVLMLFFMVFPEVFNINKKN